MHSPSGGRASTSPPKIRRLLVAGHHFFTHCQEELVQMTKNTICLWYQHDAEEAARFYAKTFPQSTLGAVHRAPADYPDGKAGDALTVDFTVVGIPCIGLNGGS